MNHLSALYANKFASICANYYNANQIPKSVMQVCNSLLKVFSVILIFECQRLSVFLKLKSQNPRSYIAPKVIFRMFLSLLVPDGVLDGTCLSVRWLQESLSSYREWLLWSDSELWRTFGWAWRPWTKTEPLTTVAGDKPPWTSDSFDSDNSTKLSISVTEKLP